MMDEPFDLGEVRRIVQAGLRGYAAEIYLFGSWAKGHPSRCSDIDVAILPREPLPQGLLSQVREALEESQVLYPVDLVDLSEASSQFRESILREGIPWSG
jgi:predicted nucleotidyltransferase